MVEYIEDDIKEVMQITGLDKAKAEKLFKSVAKDLDDGEDDELCSYDVIEVIKTEHNVKSTGSDKMYVATPKTRESKPREHKVDTDKADLIETIKRGLTLKMNSVGITVEKENKLHFTYNGSEYSVTLTKHRPPKK